MLRSLIHFWRLNLAVLGGAAVATAVLTGALLVGDSVRGSLRQLTLDRLGRIDTAVVGLRFFDENLASRLTDDAAPPGRFAEAAPAIVLRGAAIHGDSGARASNVGIHGVDERFFALFDAAPPSFERAAGQLFPSAVLNDVLARELGAVAGDTVLLRFGQFSDVPRDTLMGETDVEDVVTSQRVTVVGVVPARGWGRFALAANQQSAPNVFVELERLQRALDRRGQVNTVLLAGGDVDDPAVVVRGALRLEDYGLNLRRGEGFFDVQSAEFVLRPHVDEAVQAAARAVGSATLPLQSYLANAMTLGERSVPYSMVSALDPVPDAAWSSLVLRDGTPAPAPGAGEILLGEWAAEDLGARAGDRLRVDYYVVGADEKLSEEQVTLRVAGVVALRGLAADATLTPDYPGIQEADDMASWDPPFPVDLSRIRAKDERYWDEHRATPKAFVARETGRRLWSTRYGSTTSVRVGAAPGLDLAATEARFRDALLGSLSPASMGLQVREVRQEGLEAGVGAIDFAMYFLAFSFFLIVSAALLVGLLFSLGVEQRAREVGLRMAVGYPLRRVRRALLAEGGTLAAVGALLGALLAVGYGALLMLALTTLWLPAVGSSELALHVRPASLALGAAAAVLVVLLSIAAALRRLRRVAPTALLAGSLGTATRRRGGGLARGLAWGGLLLAMALAAYAAASGSLDNIGLTFGSGGALLISGLAWFALWCRGARRRPAAPAWPLLGMAARNSAWSPGRSILSVALIGTACYVVVVTGAYRHQFGEELQDKDSGAGGFALVAEADVPLHGDLNRATDRAELGFQTDDDALLDQARFYGFRLLPGDDASCLNLYQPERPRVLGVPWAFVERGGFKFKSVLAGDDVAADPWRVLEAAAEPGVIPAIGDANSMQYILHLALGDDLVLLDEYGREVRLRLVGVLQKSIFQSELLIAESAFREHFPSRTGYAYFLGELPFERAEEVGRMLEATLEPFGVDSTTTWDKLASYQAVEHTYLSTFQALGGLGLLLGTLGLGIVLVRNVIERRGELATMRAFGFRRARLGWMVAAETAFLLWVGMLIGTGAALVSVAPSLGGHVPWSTVAATLAAIAAFGMLACLVAVRGALRIPLLPALKAEH